MKNIKTLVFNIINNIKNNITKLISQTLGIILLLFQIILHTIKIMFYAVFLFVYYLLVGLKGVIISINNKLKITQTIKELIVQILLKYF